MTLPTEKDRMRQKALKLFEKILPASNPNSAFARERKIEAILAIEESLADERERALEEAAKICEENVRGGKGFGNFNLYQYGKCLEDEIRALKERSE